MPRRALRKRPAAVSVERHLVSWDTLPIPCLSETLFGRAGDLIVEIGSGKGLFLQSAAPLRPWELFVGVELSRSYAEFAAARLARLQVSNAVLVNADARRVMSEALTDNSVAEVHVYFPDPWWKQRHRRRRLLDASFLADVQRVLRPRGRFHFWTDVEAYYSSTLELIHATTQLEGPFAVSELPALHDLDYRTHFERRVRLNSLPVYRAEFVKAT